MDPNTSTSVKAQNGQLMHLALEVVNQSIESRQTLDHNKDFPHGFQGIALHPVCAL
tara:strand:+ start:230 stop:397 length:168 start_codon:yes stop_codon:yes gene_type:complete